MSELEKDDRQDESDEGRRKFLKAATSAAMVGGLAAGYSAFGAYAGRFLYPPRTGDPFWQYVGIVDQFLVGQAIDYVMPSGAKVVIARQTEGESEESFIALSSVCPHLGCQVHWEAVNDRFFCPCHNGAFDASGAPTEGPPAKANQHLLRFHLKIKDGILYIDVPRTFLSSPSEGGQA